jgi:tetratricopeptide (TPR) repeat protein
VAHCCEPCHSGTGNPDRERTKAGKTGKRQASLSLPSRRFVAFVVQTIHRCDAPFPLHQRPEIGDRRAEGNHLGNLGLAHAALGDTRRAIDHYQQALAIACKIGNRRLEGNALGNLGNAYFVLGDARRAIDCHEQALAIAREIGDRRSEGNHLTNMGLLARRQGDVARAQVLWAQALAIYEAIEDPRAEDVRRWLAGT